MSEKIVILGTGGTIAGMARNPADSRNYTAAQLAVADMLAALPTPVTDEVFTEQVAQLDSKDMDREVWQALLQRCRHWLAQPQVTGLVITHGTDTLEETAYLLHAVLAPVKPVVLTCAMRPANAPDADGPQNLRDALMVAAWPGARGVVVVCAGQIHAALAVQKLHTSRLDAFSSSDAGALGEVDVTGVRLSADWPESGLAWSAAALDAMCRLPAWPRVEIVMSHALAGAALVDALLDPEPVRRLGVAPVQGLVVAGTGNGTVHQSLQEGLNRAAEAGVRVVRASRCALGQVLPTEKDVFADSQGLSPVKARVALLLSLICG
jgi:L-asparaginase